MSFNRYEYEHIYDLGRELLAPCSIRRRKQIGVELMDLIEQVIGQLAPLPPRERSRRDKARLER